MTKSSHFSFVLQWMCYVPRQLQCLVNRSYCWAKRPVHCKEAGSHLNQWKLFKYWNLHTTASTSLLVSWCKRNTACSTQSVWMGHMITSSHNGRPGVIIKYLCKLHLRFIYLVLIFLTPLVGSAGLTLGHFSSKNKSNNLCTSVWHGLTLWQHHW